MTTEGTMDQPRIRAQEGETFTHSFSFSQADIERFAEVTGDVNPVHLDPAYAATTPFRKPILHGFLSASVFSKVFGTIFPGHGTIYVSQEMSFKRPMYPGERYTATFTIRETDAAKGTLVIEGRITDEKGKVCLEGVGKMINKAVFTV
ncbi:MAG TPA: MaoC family dehydratase [Cyclobacteriaceae bacterium]